MYVFSERFPDEKKSGDVSAEYVKKWNSRLYWYNIFWRCLNVFHDARRLPSLAPPNSFESHNLHFPYIHSLQRDIDLLSMFPLSSMWLWKYWENAKSNSPLTFSLVTTLDERISRQIRRHFISMCPTNFRVLGEDYNLSILENLI